jgi:hypothetical protein
MKRWIAGFLVLAIAVAFVLSNYEVGVSQNANGWFLTVNVRTALNVTGKAVITDSLRVQGVTQFNGKFTAGGTSFAKIDSFLTTAVIDTTVMSGATPGDVLMVTPYLPLWSTTADTGSCAYGAYVLNTDTVIVKRALTALPHVLKSGALYSVVKIDK